MTTKLKRGWKRGWKIVTRCVDGRLTSMCAVQVRGLGHAPEYRVGEDTVPMEDCGPLAVFDTLKAASGYQQTWPFPAELWECAYLPVDPEDTERQVLWYNELNESRVMRPDKWPPGTVCAEIVRLTKQL
jgi:hypothetical protein